MPQRGLLIVYAAAQFACVGAIDAGGESGAPVVRGGESGAPAASETPRPGSAAACRPGAATIPTALTRRLTRAEYDNTIRDLLGDTTRPASEWAAELRAGAFSNNPEALSVTDSLAELYYDTAEKVAAAAVARVNALVPCDPLKVGDDECGRTFIRGFVKRAFRRPVSAAEETRFFTVFSAGRATSFRDGVRMVITAALASPSFLYRFEVGSAPAAPGAVRSTTAWETASRLSYLVWASMPDDALFAAAETGQLSTPAQIAAQVDRMSKDPRARDGVARFLEEWLDLDRIPEIEKDATVFKGFTADLVPLLAQEATAFVRDVWDAGDLATLLTGAFTYVNKRLATFYGLPAAASLGTSLTRVALDPGRGVGVLSQGGLLSAHAKADQSSPVHRGLFVRRKLLCTTPPPPPPGVAITVPDISPTATTRERFTRHSSDPSCAACHRLMDPIGLGFESYDGAGRWRATENGRAVDASGELVASDVDGPFVGVAELGRRLSRSDQVARCVPAQWFEFAFGRIAQPEDACSLEQLGSGFVTSGLKLRDLVRITVSTDAFTHLRVPQTGGTP
jgi:hypothetical protein